MINLISGVAMMVAGMGTMFAFRARHGESHWLVRMPGMETTIALIIVCLLAGGVASLIATVLG